MGSCLSSGSNQATVSTAKVISINGNLREYFIPVTVGQALEIETTPCFLCNSDELYFEEYIKTMDSGDELEVGQIYFVLPRNQLQYRLTASDMAALAVKASSALMGISKKGSRGSKKIRITPVMEMNQKTEYVQLKRLEKSKVEIKRSGSVKMLKRSASRKAMKAYRSFRVKLSTIYEGSIAE